MMGKDIERMLSGICEVINALDAGINSVAASVSYRIETEGDYNEIEKQNIMSTSFLSNITSAVANIEEDLSKMISISEGLYTDTSSFNNSNGSPWTELNKLKESIDKFSNPVSIEYMGHRIQLLALIQIALSRAIDAKWALIIYHDYIQRAYDNIYNGNTPSIKFPGSNMEESTGNIAGNYTENVHMPKKKFDPF